MPTPPRLRPLLLALGCTVFLTGASCAYADAATGRPASVTAKSRPALTSVQLLPLMLLAEMAFARGNLDDALALYGDMTRRSDDQRIARRANEITVTHALLTASNRPAEAEALLKATLAAQESMRPALLLQLPAIFARQPDRKNTALTIDRLTASWLALPEAHMARAQAWLDAEDSDAAFLAASEAIRLGPESERAILLQARSVPATQRAAVMEALGSFGERHPEALDARLVFSRWLASEKQADKASAQYRKLLQDHPENDALAFAVVGVAAQNNDMDTVQTLLERLVQRDGNDTDRLRLLLGEVQAERGEMAAAMQTLDQVRPGTHFVPAQTRRARILASSGKIDDAVETLNAAITLALGDITPLQLAQAQLLRQNNRKEQAEVIFQIILEREPDNQETLYDAAMLAEQLGKHGLMEQHLRRLIALKPDHAHALNALGYSFAERNLRLDEADSLLSQAIQLEPEDPAIIDSVGWLRFRQGRQAEALEYLQKAYARFPDAEIASHLVEVLWTGGQQSAARTLFQAAIKASPESSPLKSVAKRLGLQ